MKLSYQLYLHLENGDFHWRSVGSSVSANSNSSTLLTRSCFSVHLRTPSPSPFFITHIRGAESLSSSWCTTRWGCVSRAEKLLWGGRNKGEGREGNPAPCYMAAGDAQAPRRITQPRRWPQEPQKHAHHCKLLSVLPGGVLRCYENKSPLLGHSSLKTVFEGFHLSDSAKNNQPVAVRLELLISSPSCLFLALKSDKQ